MIPTEMAKAWTLDGAGWRHCELPSPGWGELVVGMRASLLLPSDIDVLRRGGVPRLRAQVGDVLDAGEDCAFHPGMRIFPAWRASCGLCEACQRGNETLCLDWSRLRVRPEGLSSHQLLPAWNVRRGSVALSMSDDPAGQVFLQPLACAIRALRRANPALPLRQAVWGGGVIGRLWGMLLEVRHPSARRVLVDCDPRQCLDACTHGFHAAETNLKDASDRLEGAPDLIVLTDSRVERVVQALDAVCAGGIVIVAAEMDGLVELDLGYFQAREKRLVSSLDAGPRDFKAAGSLLLTLSRRLAHLAPSRSSLKIGQELPPIEELVPYQVIEWNPEG
ncbi:MAG: hypothetical protein RL318_2693 [Fibrobacterota bacterium]|jgi:L-iditol 2-dehydrogenase